MNQSPGTTTLSHEATAQHGDGSERSLRRTLLAYVALTKPRIIELLLITTIPTMFLAAGGFPSWLLILNTMVGGYLAAGGANVLNCIWTAISMRR